MTDPSSTQTWTCPSCNRRVPVRVMLCRCGHQRDGATLPPPQPARTSTRPVLLVLGGVLAGLGVAVLAFRSPLREDAAPRTQAPSATTRPTPADQVPSTGPTPAPEPPAFVPPFTGELLTHAPDPPPKADSTPSADPGERSFEDVIGGVLPAVASIDTGTGRGSGFFVRPDTVITNAHVVAGQSSVQLVAGGNTYSARVVLASSRLDLALLQVSNPNPRQAVLQLGTARSVRAGKEVVAIGYALGELSNTATRGIVSAVRQVNALTLLQIDAAINPGNSGGPLIDRTGTVIGINTMGATGGQGLGFAVAADHAQQLLAGQAPVSGTTPLASLQEAMGGPSGGDADRMAGTEQWNQALQRAAQAADQIDASWTQYATSCVSGTPRTSGGRPWFAVLEPAGVRLADSRMTNCTAWFESIRTRATQLRDFLRTQAEVARRAGLYPGTIRDMRRRHRLEWDGWEG